MNIEHIQKNKMQGYFVAKENLKEVGRITYVMSEETKLVIDHTEVAPEQKGHGIGKRLVLNVVEYARANKLKILPICTFAKAVFDKTPEIQDVLF